MFAESDFAFPSVGGPAVVDEGSIKHYQPNIISLP